MQRRSFLPALLVLLAAGACDGAREKGRARPNVIFVVVDTLRADSLPVPGGSNGTGDATPFLTGLLASSVVFETCWSTSSWTPPATASIFTGTYPNQHGVVTGLHAYRRQKQKDDSLTINRLPGALQTLPELMQSLGYRTFGVVDNPTIGREIGFDRGFDRFRVFSYKDAEVVNLAVEAMRHEIRGSEPYFLYVHYMDPHAPYHPRRPWFEGEFQGFHAGGNREASAAIRKQAYDSEVSFLDHHLQELFELLEVEDDAVVVLTADHGEEFLEHDGFLHGFQLYSELTRVPLLIRHPGVAPARIAGGVSIVDVLPTLRTILGTPPSDQDAGVDLVPVYTTDRALPERPLFQMRTLGRERRMAAVVAGTYKYVVDLVEGTEELYDLAADPGETIDLIEDRPAEAERLRATWREFDATARRWEGESTDVHLDPVELLDIRKLGYADDAGEDG